MFRLRNMLLLGAAFVMLVAMSAPLIAGSDLEVDSTVGATAGVVVGGSGTPSDVIQASGFTPSGTELEPYITTSSATYDSTVLTKYVPGTAFVADASIGDIVNLPSVGTCVYPDAASSGSLIAAYAPVELPNGALITGATLFGEDSDTTDMFLSVDRSTVSTPSFLFPGTSSRNNSSLGSGTTGTLSGIGAVYFDVDPDVGTGTTGSFLTGTTQTYLSLYWEATVAAGVNHTLCGVNVYYKVPTTGDNQVFTPLTPCAIFDSRPGQGGTGTFTGNESRDITITGDTTAIGGSTACGISSAATAVQLNILVLNPVGTGTFKAWAQGATEPAGLVAFANDLTRWNGSATVPIAANDQMSIKMKNSAADVRLVVTGYYSAVSNMSN